MGILIGVVGATNFDEDLAHFLNTAEFISNKLHNL